VLAIGEGNAKGGPGGYEVKVLTLDADTTTARQYDPAQAATPCKARGHSMKTAT
jgi:hypothetical protein